MNSYYDDCYMHRYTRQPTYRTTNFRVTLKNGDEIAVSVRRTYDVDAADMLGEWQRKGIAEIGGAAYPADVIFKVEIV